MSLPSMLSSCTAAHLPELLSKNLVWFKARREQRNGEDQFAQLVKSEFFDVLDKHSAALSSTTFESMCSESKVGWTQPILLKEVDRLEKSHWQALSRCPSALPLLNASQDKLVAFLDDADWFALLSTSWVSESIVRNNMNKAGLRNGIIRELLSKINRLEAQILCQERIKYEVLVEVESKYMARLDAIEDKLQSITSEQEKFATLFKDEFATALATELEKVNTGRDESLTEEIDSLLVRMHAMETEVNHTVVSTQHSISELEAMVVAMSDKVDSLAPLPAAKSVDEMIAEAVETVAGVVSDDDFSRDECRKWFERKVSRSGRVPDDALIQTYLFAEWDVEWSRDSLIAVGDALMRESVAKSA